MSKKRVYTQRKRQQNQDETRQRIVEAAMHLHEEIGPRATSISAIAERAGVTRVTVYRHFPDETAVFQACTAHWLRLNPPPDPQAWMKEKGPLERVRRAVAAFHRYYADTSGMWAAAHRDAPEVPALQAPMAAFEGYLEEVTKGLMRALRARRNRRLLEATLGHALAFETWASLESRGLDDARKTDLVVHWVAALL